MSAFDREIGSLELQLLPGDLFESIHPAIDFNRVEVMRERVPLASRVVALLARSSRPERGEVSAPEKEEVTI